MTFAEAYTRLQTIATDLQAGQVFDVEHIVKLQAEAKQLYDFCDGVLKKNETTSKN